MFEKKIKEILINTLGYKENSLDGWFVYPDGYTRKGLPKELISSIHQIAQLYEGDEDGLIDDNAIKCIVNNIAEPNSIMRRYEFERRDDASSCIGSALLWAQTVRRYTHIGIKEGLKAQQALTKSLDQKGKEEAVKKAIKEGYKKGVADQHTAADMDIQEAVRKTAEEIEKGLLSILRDSPDLRSLEREIATFVSELKSRYLPLTRSKDDK